MSSTGSEGSYAIQTSRNELLKGSKFQILETRTLEEIMIQANTPRANGLQVVDCFVVLDNKTKVANLLKIIVEKAKTNQAGGFDVTGIAKHPNTEVMKVSASYINSSAEPNTPASGILTVL